VLLLLGTLTGADLRKVNYIAFVNAFESEDECTYLVLE
jgi:hypothetical protein